VEGDPQLGEIRPTGEPQLGGAAHAPLLLRADHLRGLAERRAGLLLHLDETKLGPPARDQVDLVAARPHVRADDPPAAQPVPARRAPLSRVQAPTCQAPCEVRYTSCGDLLPDPR